MWPRSASLKHVFHVAGTKTVVAAMAAAVAVAVAVGNMAVAAMLVVMGVILPQ